MVLRTMPRKNYVANAIDPPPKEGKEEEEEEAEAREPFFCEGNKEGEPFGFICPPRVHSWKKEPLKLDFY